MGVFVEVMVFRTGPRTARTRGTRFYARGTHFSPRRPHAQG